MRQLSRPFRLDRSRVSYRWAKLLLTVASALTLRATGDDSAPRFPRTLDSRLVVELVASEPDIVTPFGITVDAQGRVLVVESHTHMRPPDYEGPPSDRIRLLTDSDGDGRPDQVTTWYEGERWLMNITAHPNGWIYAVSRNELFRLRDADGDGRAEQRQSLARLQTEADYPHNGFLSVAVDGQGNLLFGLGQNYGAPYRLEDNGGVVLSSDRGDGGVFRCRPDGTGLVRVAVGFWNPCGIAADPFGRIFAVDNDPGNRPPCRLLEIVAGGDYGYRRHELEPFIAWNGELPGTLPMIASTPEAPTDLLRCGPSQLLPELTGGFLVSSWSEYRVDVFHLSPSDASFRAKSRPLLQGGPEFRPTGLAWGTDGSLYISDWVDRSYPVHGRGRIWRVRLRDDGAQRNPAARPVATNHGEPGPEVSNWEHRVATGPLDQLDVASILAPTTPPRVCAACLRRLDDRRWLPQLVEAVQSADPYIRHAAREGLAHTANRNDLRQLFRDTRASVRLAAILVIRKHHERQFEEIVEEALSDANDSIRFVATEWLATRKRKADRALLLRQLHTRPMSGHLFEATLAAVAKIDGVMEQWKPGRNGDWWKPRSKAYSLVARLFDDKDVPLGTLRRAIEFLPPGHEALSHERLRRWMEIAKGDRGLQLAIVRRMPLDARGIIWLRGVIEDRRRDEHVRAEALMRWPVDRREQVRALIEWAQAQEMPTSLRREALASLRGARLTANDVRTLVKLSGRNKEFSPLVATVLAKPPHPDRPPRSDLDAWLARIGTDGDPLAGQRVFFHPRGAGCFKCHRIDGRGEAVGPAFYRTPGVERFSRRSLLRAILSPSTEIAHGFESYRLRTKDGRVWTGILRTETDREYRLFDQEGREFAVPRDQVEAVVPGDVSLMPDGLVDRMTDRELRDLLAFLQAPAEPE